MSAKSIKLSQLLQKKIKPSLFPDRVSMNCKHLQTKFTDISNSKLFNFFLDEVLELPGLYCLRKNFFWGQLFCIHEYTLYIFPIWQVYQRPQFSKAANSARWATPTFWPGWQSLIQGSLSTDLFIEKSLWVILISCIQKFD